MTKAINPRRAMDKGETLSPISGRAYISVETESAAILALREGASVSLRGGLPPGFRREPRSLLSFILRVLDGKHRQMVRQHLEHFLRFNFQWSTPEVDQFQRRLHEDPALMGYAADSMIATMREMADMWIDSGKSRTDRDVDTPADRNVEDVLPGRDYSLFQRIDRSLLRSYPRYTEMRRDGSLQIKDAYPHFDVDRLDGFWGLDEVMKAHGAKWAAFYFSRLLNSPDSRSISRCDYCKAYFAYQRARLRTVTHGVFCPACEGQGSMKRTQSSRDKRFDAAARAVIEWESKHKGAVPPEWIAEQVNKSHGTAFGRRWVSQNLIKIQERMEALQHATRKN